MITIAIIKYKGLSKCFFEKSLYSALSQISVDYKIDVYYEDKLDWCLDEKICIKRIPENIVGKGCKIREYVVDNTDTLFVAFWDSDDVYTIDRLHEQYKEIEEDNLDICFSNFCFFDDGRVYTQDFFSLIGYGDRDINIFDENYIGLGTIVAKVSYLKRLEPFPDLRYFDWWIAIKSTLNNARIGSCGVCGYYRLHEKSLSSSFSNPQKQDFINEINRKLDLYKAFPDNGGLIKRLNFYSKIQLDNDYEALKQDFVGREFKNIWGGLIKYNE